MDNEEYVLYTTTEYYYIVPSHSKHFLIIDRASQEIVLEYDRASIPANIEGITIYGIWGCIKLLSGMHLLVITAREKAGELFGHIIWKIIHSDVLPYTLRASHLSDVQIQDERVYCQMLHTVLGTEGFYYSASYDLTQTLQRLSELGPTSKEQTIYERAEARFMWNGFVLNEMLQQLQQAVANYTNTHKSPPLPAFNPYKLCIPIIQGFVGILPNPRGSGALARSDNMLEKTSETTYAIISRRSVFHTGTRFNARGLDKSGNAANTIETEQLLEIDRNRFSFVQLRGSVPIYWSQKPNLRYKPIVLLGGSQLSMFTSSVLDEERLSAMQTNVLQNYFNELIHTQGYGQQVIINLLNHTGMERGLCRAYAAAAMDLNANEIKYESFDFHHECGSTRWDRLGILLERLVPDLVKMRQFHLTLGTFQVISRQRGTFRSNCIDCLDRTNVVQSMLGWCALEQALIDIGELPVTAGSTSASASTNSVLAQQWPGFSERFKSIWTDNADLCSLQYTGTRALKTDFTRTGRRTIYGMLMDGYHSLLRYFMNNFSDGFRQDSMHLFLGDYRVHESDGTPKPLTGPAGRVRHGSLNHVDNEWRTQFLPLVFTFAVAMSVLCFVLPTTHWTERVTYVLFWGTASVLSAFGIFAYGEEFVDRPRFSSD